MNETPHSVQRSTVRSALIVVLVPLLFNALLRAQAIGEGALVIRDTDRNGLATIYVHDQGDSIEAQMGYGDYVAGFTPISLINQLYTFETKNGRVHVVYFAKKDQSGIQRTAWMDPNDLKTFTYDCSCGPREFRGLKSEACSPFAKAGFVKRKWNECFLQARDQTLAEAQGQQPNSATAGAANATDQGGNDDKPLSMDDILKATATNANGGNASQSGTPPQESSRQRPRSKEAQKGPSTAFTNKDVIALVKAGLGDKVVIDKIHSSSPAGLDTSTDALIHLKRAGVSKAIIDAIVQRKAGE